MIRLGLRTGWLLVVMTAAGASATSCGGDGGSCGMVSSCGGDIVGDWRITSSCIKSMDTLGADFSCPTGTVTSSATATGTASYRTDMTYTVSFTLTGTDSVVIPASCLSAGTTCDQVNQVFFRGLLPDLRCSSASGGCNCSLVIPATPLTETGTYATTGGALTTTPSSGTPDTGGYCVKGNQLDLTPPAAMAGATGTMSGDLTLMRQ
jgi:hypothetical protein